MARLNADPAGSSVRSSSRFTSRGAETPRASRSNVAHDTARTVSPGSSSDKENAHGSASRKRLSGSMAPPVLPTSAGGVKRRRLGEQMGSRTSTPGAPQDSQRFYDPEQNEAESSAIARNLREINRRVHDSRDQLLKPGDDGIIRVVQDMNENLSNVRQTTHAKTDSTILLNVSDLHVRRTTNAVVGDGSTGIDVDEFVAKCITFMRNGGPPAREEEDAAAPGPTQGRRPSTQSTQRRRSRRAEEDEDEEGNALAWDVLGELACFPSNSRPPVPGFLVGPLSVQKRARAPTQRRARADLRDQPRTQPQTLDSEDLERSESNHLTALCQKIRTRLSQIIEEGQGYAHDRWKDDMTPEQENELMRSVHLADNGGVSLLEFAINPHSFGQSVENLFYISFLIKEGSVKINQDSNGLPTLDTSKPRSVDEQREQNVSKHQAIFSLDWPTWQTLIKAFDMTEPLIEHRHDEQTQIATRGWYG